MAEHSLYFPFYGASLVISIISKLYIYIIFPYIYIYIERSHFHVRWFISPFSLVIMQMFIQCLHNVHRIICYIYIHMIYVYIICTHYTTDTYMYIIHVCTYYIEYHPQKVLKTFHHCSGRILLFFFFGDYIYT